MSFSHDKFLKPITSKDRYIQILDDNGVTKHLINPFSIINVMVSNNLLRINLRENKFISILFNSINESKLALVNIQIQIEQLTTKVPFNIEKSVENYILDKTNINYGNGLSLTGATLSVGGDLTDTLYINGQYNNLIGVGFDIISFTSSVFDVVSDFISLDSIDNIQILAQNDLVIDAGQVISISGSSSLVSISDGRGLVYQSDYSSSFVTQSIVDKLYVDNKVTNISEINSTTFSINSANTIVDGHILPSLNLTYDLGSTSSQWRSLHVGSGSIYIGGVTLSSSGDSLVVNSISVGGPDSNLVISSGNNNLNVSGDLVVDGNMTVNGTTSTINTENLIVKDALILLASDQSGTPTLDSGILINRGTGLTQGFVWDESEGHFALLSTEQSSLLEQEILISSYSDLKLNNLKSQTIQITEGAQSDYILISDVDGNASWTASIPGTSGTSGSSGSSGTSGSSGSSGTSGSSGSSGTSGSSGSSGTSGSSGSSGTSGSSGSSGTSGSSGSSGANGTSGTSGIGTNGTSGTSGIGTNGTSGTSGITPITAAVNYSQNKGIKVTVPSGASLPYTIISTSITTNGGPVQVIVSGDANPASPGWGRISIYRDSTEIGQRVQFESDGGNENNPYCLQVIDTPSSGTYTYSLKLTNQSATNVDFGEDQGPIISVIELQNVIGATGVTGSTGVAGTSGTSGTTPTTSLSLSENLTVSGTSSFNGLTVLQEVIEVINSTPGATASTVFYDFTTGSNWYHSSATTNYTANFTNVPTTDNRAITATIIINQGSTAYIPTSVQINSVSQTIKWSGGTASGNANQVDIVGFTFIRSGGSWAQVLGQINTFD
jgi:hypothetical protein